MKENDSFFKKNSLWLLTFSDLSLILLIIFILLYAVSNFNDSELEQTSSIDSSPDYYGVVHEYEKLPSPIDSSTAINDINEKEFKIIEEERRMNELIDLVTEFSLSNGLGNELRAIMTKEGVELILPESLLFETAKADILDNAKKFLSQITPLIKNLDNEIKVEGHTDNVPINNIHYESNWELSTDRAISVVQYMVNSQDLNPSRFAAIGYGEHRPINPNNSKENKKNNRRVVITISHVLEH